MARARFRAEPGADKKLAEMTDEFVAETVLPKIVNRAKRIAPVDTGALEASIHSESSDDGHFVIADTEYAAFVELGTSKQAAQPYLRPALQSGLTDGA